MFYEAEPQYIGVGETEDEAIKDCMERIKDVPFAEIFNDLKK